MKVSVEMQFGESVGVVVPERADVTVELPHCSTVYHIVVPGDDLPYIVEQDELDSMKRSDEARKERARRTNLLNLVGDRVQADVKAIAARYNRQWELRRRGRPPIPSGIQYQREMEVIARIVQEADHPMMVGDIGKVLGDAGISLAWQTIKKYLVELERRGEVGSFKAGRYYRYTKPGIDPLEGS